MKGGMAIAALAVAAVVGAGAPSAARAAFLDASSWHNAVVALDASLRASGRTVRYVPFAARPIEYEDGYGTFTQHSREWVFATLAWDNPYIGTWVQRHGGTFEMADGLLRGWLGCDSAHFPCFGATRVTLGFDGEVLGFGGRLTWWLGHQYPPTMYGDPSPILPFFQATHAAAGHLYDDNGDYYGEGYDGFFGVLGPLDAFELSFYDGESPDWFVTVAFSGLMLLAVPVPEPPALPLLAAALALLGLAGAGRALSPAAGSR